ncbi:MAG: T9SS type A sorting domain-containing protein, partial [Candidatus Krumholzibacteria bacterium]|nr:T9SS type A sorting domain-containing protein [Candidatus Krumholzibacteria bacterium]
TIRLYDVTGRLVKTLVDEPRPAGAHQVSWDGRNGRGEPVATGVYFYRMQAGTFVQTRKMVLLK